MEFNMSKQIKKKESTNDSLKDLNLGLLIGSMKASLDNLDANIRENNLKLETRLTSIETELKKSQKFRWSINSFAVLITFLCVTIPVILDLYKRFHS